MAEIFSYGVLGTALALYFALGALRWTLGMRSDAIRDFEKGVQVAVYLLVVMFILRAADELAIEVGLDVRLTDPVSAGAALRRAAALFWNASRLAVDTVLYVATERAVLAAAPLTTPLSSVLGAATGWSTAELSLVAVFFMHLSFTSDILSRVSALLLAAGATLTPISATRRAGAALLAAYLSGTVSIAYAGAMVDQALAQCRLPSGANPVDWLRVAAIVGDTAVALGSAATKSFVAIALGSITGMGLANLFGSIYISLARL